MPKIEQDMQESNIVCTCSFQAKNGTGHAGICSHCIKRRPYNVHCAVVHVYVRPKVRIQNILGLFCASPGMTFQLREPLIVLVQTWAHVKSGYLAL